MFPSVAFIVALAGQKGGTGKSTIACSVAAEGIARGNRVLLVDADPQGTAQTWGDVAAEQGKPTPTIVQMGMTMHRPGQLETVAEPYGLVVIDCPPRHGEIQRSALLVAHVAILPCGPSAADAWALASSLEAVSDARTVRADLGAYVVITRKQGHTAIGKGAREALAAGDLAVLRTELGYRVAYQEALAAGEGVTTYSSGAAANELRALFDEVHALKEARPHVQAQARRRAPKA
jgi:chromosome partitioning protein